MGRVCSANLGRNLDMAVRRPTRRCTSLTLVGLHISIIALHYLRLASIPRCVSMKPRNFQLSTSKIHFLGLSVRLYYHRAKNTADKSCACYRWLGELITMSSMYTSTHLPTKWLNTLSINL